MTAPFLTYWSGIGAKVTFQPFLDDSDTLGDEVDGISNTEWNIDQSNRLAEVSNAVTGNHAARIPCLDDTDASFTVVWDSSLPPESAGLFAGNQGLLKAYLGESTQGKSQYIIIEKVSTKAVVQQGAIQYVVTYKGNSEVSDF